MREIDYKQLAKEHDLTYYELMNELMIIVAAHMSLECERHNTDNMELTIEDTGTLTYETKLER